MSHVHCPECGFQNLEAAKYCEKCGALLIQEEGGQTTMSIAPGETEEDATAGLAEIRVEGPALIVRAGGGRAGESFELARPQLTIGRSPESDVFLDDVTVSRTHARLVRRDDGYWIEDLGSLNGTFVNRRRVEAQALEDGDEVQIGKYKLTFLER